MSDAERSNRESDAPRGTGGEPQDTRSLAEHCRQVYDDAHALAAAVKGATDELERYLTQRVDDRPYMTLGVAAGAGYILGGGLRSRFTAVLLGAATRVGMALAVREVAARLSPGASASAENTGPREGVGAGEVRS